MYCIMLSTIAIPIIILSTTVLCDTNLHATLASCASWFTVNSLHAAIGGLLFFCPTKPPPDSTLCRLGGPCQWQTRI